MTKKWAPLHLDGKAVAVLVRRGSRVTIESLCKAVFPKEYKGLPILVVDNLDDIRELSDKELFELGWEKRRPPRLGDGLNDV